MAWQPCSRGKKKGKGRRTAGGLVREAERKYLCGVVRKDHFVAKGKKMWKFWTFFSELVDLAVIDTFLL